MREACNQCSLLYTRSHQPNATCAHSHVLKQDFVKFVLDLVLGIRPRAFYILGKPVSLCPRPHPTFPH